MTGRMTFKRALELAEPLKQVGSADVYLDDDDPDLPWDLVSGVEAGCAYRLGAPAGVKFTVEHPTGLTFRWEVRFENRDANGHGISLFDRSRLREVMMKLPAAARKRFVAFLDAEVLPALRKSSDELRNAMNAQIDSEECVRGLIEFGSR